MTAVHCDVEDHDLHTTFAGIFARISDLRPVWPSFADEFAAHEATVFATEGASIGERWAPLTPDYAAWKQTVRPGRGTLVFDEDLRESLTSLPLGVQEFHEKYAEVGTDDHTAVFHQYGTRRMPARPPVGADAVLANETARLLAGWIFNGDPA